MYSRVRQLALTTGDRHYSKKNVHSGLKWKQHPYCTHLSKTRQPWNTCETLKTTHAMFQPVPLKHKKCKKEKHKRRMQHRNKKKREATTRAISIAHWSVGIITTTTRYENELTGRRKRCPRAGQSETARIGPACYMWPIASALPDILATIRVHSRSNRRPRQGRRVGQPGSCPECRAGKAVAWTTRDSHELRANAGGASPTWRTAQVRRHFRSGKLRAEVTLFRFYGKYSSETTVQTPRTCGVAVRVCGHTFAVSTLQLKVQQKRERNAKGHERNDCVSQHDVFSRHDSPRVSERDADVGQTTSFAGVTQM